MIELVDFKLVATNITPTFEVSVFGDVSSRPEASRFVLADTCVPHLKEALRQDGQSTERVSDNDAFWSNSKSVLGALPSMLQGFRNIVSQHVLPETFCFAAPSGH